MKFLKYAFKVQAIFLICLFLTPNRPALSFEGRIPVEYAETFMVERENGRIILTITESWPGAEEPLNYVLVNRGKDPGEIPQNAVVIEVPVRTCVSTTTVNLAFMEELCILPYLVGQGGKRYVYDPPPGFENVPEIGSGTELDLEKILELSPEVIFAYAYSPAERDLFRRLEEMGIHVVLMSEYLERTPLGRAEWIKYLSYFFCKEIEAERIFEEVRTRYEELACFGRSQAIKPGILCNIPFSGIWYMPGGQNWSAELLRDAGGDYPWSGTMSKGSSGFDLEEVFAEAGNAHIWINPGDCGTLEDLRSIDGRFTLFRAFRDGEVYNNTRRISSDGGNDYHQRGVLRPDQILEDLISIFHPSLMPEHELRYYKKLK
ncbi:MAG: ABC transporter substrate-binding protein [Synergistales bacterium]|nr:ABC transporter substrate-binding protein [Synergistales bacterium]